MSQIQQKVLFVNMPYWVKEGDTPLRKGIRAGSRWPYSAEADYPPDSFRLGTYMPFPMFMGYAAGWLRVVGGDQGSGKWTEVKVRDSIARGESYSSFGAFLKKDRPDWIVVETATNSWPHDRRCIALMKQLLPEVKFVLCGTIGANAEAVKEALDIEGVMAVVQGEYEKGVAAAILAGQTGIIAHSFLTQEEMSGDRSHWPMWDEEVATHYFDACPRGQKQVQLQMWSGRGCPHVCNFCSWPAQMTNDDPDGKGGRKVRFHTPEWIEGYIRHRQDIMGPLGSVYFDDDTFNLGDRHVKAVSEVMKKLHIPWAAMCRADSCSREGFMAMRDSGCFGVKIGFESGSDRVVNRIIGKKLNLVEAADTAVWLRSIGMEVHGTFMLGLPGETKEEQQMTIRFINDLYQRGGLSTHQLSGTAEIDGTPLANLRVGESNPKFPDATKDKNYVPSKDGLMKAEQMQNALTLA